MATSDNHNRQGMVRAVFSKILKQLRGRDYDLDSAVPLTALFSLGARRVVALLRGSIRHLLFRGTPKLLFMGPGVEIRNISFISFGRGVTLDRHVFVDGLSHRGVRIGNGVSIGRSSILRCTGVLSNLGVGIEIGDNTGFDAFCFVGAAGGVRIGKNVIMGQHVSFHAENHNFGRIDQPIRLQGTTRAGIVVGDDCWIGSNVTFLDGANVGRGCIIGAGAVVRGTIPDHSIAVGVPARVLKKREFVDA